MKKIELAWANKFRELVKENTKYKDLGNRLIVDSFLKYCDQEEEALYKRFNGGENEHKNNRRTTKTTRNGNEKRA